MAGTNKQPLSLATTHHVNSRSLKKYFSITWQQAKEIIRKCPTCSLYNQIPLPAGSNSKGTQRNEILQMDVFYFVEFGKLDYVHHWSLFRFSIGKTFLIWKDLISITYIIMDMELQKICLRAYTCNNMYSVSRRIRCTDFLNE